MVIKTASKILLVGILLYGGWYVYSFIHAWAGIGIIAAVFIGLAAYVEKEVKKNLPKD
jgi:hypothetical protein